MFIYSPPSPSPPPLSHSIQVNARYINTQHLSLSLSLSHSMRVNTRVINTYLVITRMPDENYRRRLLSLFVVFVFVDVF